eukprot:c17451_g1_i1.p1 GENE.c17451_g1_i1~~c17451_g1_i1.p1  ORF type:complete len:619 (+),score=116.79 c17451_g1_i1:31-1887(+)
MLPLLSVFVLLFVAAEAVSTTAWVNTATDQSWPEFIRPVSGRPNNGVCFVGGGTRSYTSSLGYLRAFAKLGLIDNIRYFSGVSGGAWAISTYSYRQNGLSDADFLGTSHDPEQLTLAKLAVINSTSMAGAIPELINYSNEVGFQLFFSPNATANTVNYLLKSHPNSQYEYIDLISKFFLERIGVEPSKYFSWDNTEVAHIQSRNPSLKNSDFVLPIPHSPFLIIGGTILGPPTMAPLTGPAEVPSYKEFEFTPLYAGTSFPQTREYANRSVTKEISTGGYVEPFAFGATPISTPTAGLVNVTLPDKRFSLAQAIGISSLALGSILMANSSYTRQFPENIPFWDLVPNYPIVDLTHKKVEDMMLADGGAFENVGILALIRRKVRNIFVIDNAGQSIDENTNIQSLFGISPSSPLNIGDGHDYTRNQVFDSSKYSVLLDALKARISAGDAAIVNMTLVTIANDWWRIPSGQEVVLVWSYIHAPQKWLDRLPTEVKEALKDQTATGTFYNFPRYDTFTQFFLSSKQTNLLAEMTSYIVETNAELIISGLGISNSSPSPSPTPTKKPKHKARLEPAAIISIVTFGVLAIGFTVFCIYSRRRANSRKLVEHTDPLRGDQEDDV